MKRFFTLIVTITITLAALAQHPLVTLSHNGELSFFSTLSALEDAINSAENGDIIYLSEGKFTTNSSDLRIDKRISIIGCGYKSHILARVIIEFSNTLPTTTENTPMFDGVRLQTLLFENSTQSRDNLKDVEIRNSWIKELQNGGYAGNNFLLDKCYIEEADFYGANYNNTSVQNCKIGRLQNSGISSIEVINCNIKETDYCPRLVISSIIEGNPGNVIHNYGTHAVFNSLFPSPDFIQNSYISLNNCYFENPEGGLLDENLEATINLTEKGYVGEDGTVIGIRGGSQPFSENPSVPTVDSEKSSVTFDAENNRLNVTIKVKSN